MITTTTLPTTAQETTQQTERYAVFRTTTSSPITALGQLNNHRHREADRRSFGVYTSIAAACTAASNIIGRPIIASGHTPFVQVSAEPVIARRITQLYYQIFIIRTPTSESGTSFTVLHNELFYINILTTPMIHQPLPDSSINAHIQADSVFPPTTHAPFFGINSQTMTPLLQPPPNYQLPDTQDILGINTDNDLALHPETVVYIPMSYNSIGIPDTPLMSIHGMWLTPTLACQAATWVEGETIEHDPSSGDTELFINGYFIRIVRTYLWYVQTYGAPAETATFSIHASMLLHIKMIP
jgi:hypothetical protein